MSLVQTSPSERKAEALACASSSFSTCMIPLLCMGHTLLQRHKLLSKNGMPVLYLSFQMKPPLKNYRIPEIFILYGAIEL